MTNYLQNRKLEAIVAINAADMDFRFVQAELNE